VKALRLLTLASIVVAAPFGGATAQIPFCPVSTDAARAPAERLFERDDERVGFARETLASQDVTHHEIELCVDPERRWVSGVSTITLEATGPRARFLLNESLSVRTVRADGAGLIFLRSGRILEVNLPAGYAERPLDIEIRYAGVVHPGRAVVAAPDLVLLGRECCWYPAPAVADPATYRILVRYPEGYGSVCTGVLSGMAPSLDDREDPCAEGDVWIAGSPVSSAAVAVGRFESELSVLRSMFFSCHRATGSAEPHDAGDRAPSAFRSAELKELVRFIENCYGPYPYEWLNVVTVPEDYLAPEAEVSGPGFVVVRDPTHPGGTPGDEYLARYALALSKSWWPYAVDAGVLVSEALAAHTEIAWLEATVDDEVAAERREMRLAQYVRALSDSAGRASLSSCLGLAPTADRRICRGKGALVMGLLEQVLGRDAFCAATRELRERHAGETIGLREFVAVLEDVSGSDLSWFVYEWVHRSDLPSYALEYETVALEGGGHLVRGTISQPGQIYRTPLPLTVDLGVWSYEEWIPIESSVQDFAVETGLEPLRVVLDARRLVPRVEPAELARFHFERGVVAGAANEWGLALEELEAAASLEPGSGDYSFGYGEALVNSGRLAEGLGVLETAVDLDPEGLANRLWLARLYLRLNDYEAALAHLDAYLARSPEHSDVHNERARALIGLGRLDEAGRAVEKLRSLVVASEGRVDSAGSVYLSAGRFHEASGDLPAAVRAYRLAVEAEPDLVEARERLDALAAQLGGP